MKKKTGNIYAIILLLAVVVGVGLYLNGCQSKLGDEKANKEETSVGSGKNSQKIDVEQELVSREKGDVIWTISDDVQVNEKYLNIFNDKLKKEGYDCQLKFQYLGLDDYDKKVENVLKNGQTDIVLAGQSTDDTPNPTEVLSRKGLLLCLDDYLQSDAGRELSEEYESPLWGSVKIDGHIYTIPNGIYDDGRYCVVFNNKYIDAEKSKGFRGDLLSLDRYLSDDVKKNPENKELLWDWNTTDLASVMGYYEKYGVFFGGKTGEIKTPYESKEISAFFEMLYQLNRKKCIASESTFSEDLGEDYKKIKDKIKKRNFSILLTKETDIIRNMGNDVTVVPLDFVPNFGRAGGTNGICAASENVDNALLILSLLHTEDTFAHLLLYGKEGEDYKLSEGKIITENGPGVELIDVLGIFRSSYPGEEDTVYTQDIRQQKKAIYRSEHCKTSVLSGFQIDEKALSQEEIDAGTKILKYMDVWKSEAFPKKFEEIKQKSREDMKNLLKEISRQLEAWKEKTE